MNFFARVMLPCVALMIVGYFILGIVGVIILAFATMPVFTLKYHQARTEYKARHTIFIRK